MIKENEELEVTQGADEIEEIEVTPGADNIADELTSKQLDKKIEKLVNEKIALAQEAQDNEEEETNEEPEEKKGLGLFPKLLIGAVVVVGVSTLLLKNRPISHSDEAETQNQGYGNE